MAKPIHSAQPRVSRPGSPHVLQVLLCSPLGAVARQEGRSSACIIGPLSPALATDSWPPPHAWPAGACKSLERQRCKPSSDRPSSQGSPPRDAKRCGSSCLAGSTRVFASPWHRMRQPSRFACEFRTGCTEAVSYLAESPDGYMASLKARFQQACRSDIYWVPPA